jgi:hypothetical protein
MKFCKNNSISTTSYVLLLRESKIGGHTCNSHCTLTMPGVKVAAVLAEATHTTFKWVFNESRA